jgi:hypothetical protein
MSGIILGEYVLSPTTYSADNAENTSHGVMAKIK